MDTSTSHTAADNDTLLREAREKEEQARQAEEDKLPLYRRLRNAVLPVKPEDAAIVRLMKHTGFAIFSVIFGLVTLAITLAISFAL